MIWTFYIRKVAILHDNGLIPLERYMFRCTYAVGCFMVIALTARDRMGVSE